MILCKIYSARTYTVIVGICGMPDVSAGIQKYIPWLEEPGQRPRSRKEKHRIQKGEEEKRNVKRIRKR